VRHTFVFDVPVSDGAYEVSDESVPGVLQKVDPAADRSSAEIGTSTGGTPWRGPRRPHPRLRCRLEVQSSTFPAQ
jgi:hypothetical protein